MNAALILVDLQNDFLRRDGLHPDAAQVTARCAELLASFRGRGWPVFHVHTLVRADGSDRMPHWAAQGVAQCVEGTEGAQAPAALEPRAGETVVGKRFYSGFESGALDGALHAHDCGSVVIAGLYTHACVRATALDAYARGHEVWVADDAVASPEPLHAQVSAVWMGRRGIRIAGVAKIRQIFRFSDAPCSSAPSGKPVHDDAAAIARAAAAASQAQPAWARTQAGERAALLDTWAALVDAQSGPLAALIAQEIGKPLADAREEVGRTAANIAASARLLRATPMDAPGANGIYRVRLRPVGTVALVTPWNNPLAIPAGKIAPALAFGNSVVWKPALPAPRCTQALLELLERAGLPAGLVHVVHGDGAAARALVSETAVSAVSFTGSNAAGEQIAALCALWRKPLQAELGGNNAAVVCADADLDAAAQAIAASAFGFAGQRCTSTRRIIVEAAVREAFVPRLLARIAALVVGDALDAATQVGPLISQAHLERVAAQVEQARVARSARVLCGGTRSTGHRPGAWYLPTLIDGVEPDAPIVQQETFGPVAVLQTAQDFAHALVLCNGVAQGLVASLFSQDPARHAQFLEGAHAGVLRINPASFPVHPEAPFLGWGSSGLGPAEHGRWDIEFYSRPQAVYGQAGPPKP